MMICLCLYGIERPVELVFIVFPTYLFELDSP